MDKTVDDLLKFKAWQQTVLGVVLFLIPYIGTKKKIQLKKPISLKNTLKF